MTFQGITSKKAAEYYYENDPIFNPENDELDIGSNIQWNGKLKEKLGVGDDGISPEQSYNLFQGKSIDGENQLLDRSKNTTNGKENAVYDIPLTAPKSVSAMALVDGGDKRLVEAFQKASKTTVDYFEKNLVQTRGYIKQEDGSTKRETYKTDNALIATATHSTNRNNDVHLHDHMLVTNLTYDQKTDTYKALNLDFNKVKEVQSVMNTELMKNVKELGYDINIKENGSWDLKGFDEKTITALSTRKQEIQEEVNKLDEKDIDSSTNRTVGFKTKNEKDFSVSNDDVQIRAKKQLESVGTTIEELKEKSLKDINVENTFKNEKEVLEKTMEHLTASNARVSEDELLNSASKIAKGEFSYNDLKNELSNVKKTGQKDDFELKRLDTDKNGNNHFTTKEMSDTEKNIVNTVKQNNQVDALLTKEQAENGLRDFEDKYFKLSSGQKQAAMSILTSTEQYGATQGVAGSGKSTMFKAVAHSLKYNDNNADVLVAAVANKAVSGAVEASKMDTGESFKGQTLHKATRGGLTDFMKSDDINKRVENIAKNMNDIKLSSGSFSFSNNKGFSIDPANSFSINSIKEFETTKTSRKTNFSGANVINKTTKVHSGEHKGSIKKEKTTISSSNASIKYESTITNNKDETFKQKIETFNPVKLGGENNSPMAKLGNKIIGSKSSEIRNDRGFSKNSNLNISGVSFNKTFSSTDYGSQSKLNVNAMGVVKAEQNIKSFNSKDKHKDITEKSFSVLGFSSKTVLEETYNKNGELVDKISVNEKSFMGISMGKTITLNDKEVNTYNYSKNDDKINDIKQSSSNKISSQSEKEEVSKKMNEETTKSNTKLLIIEEASMASAKDVNEIMKQVSDLKKDGVDVKVQFVGDTNQLLPIGSGSPFEQIKETLDDKVSIMNESQRQRNDTEKNITDSISDKEIKTSFENMEKSNGIKEIKDDKERLDFLVKELTKKESVEVKNFKNETELKNIDYKNTIGLAATNEENKTINNAVRNKLKNDGLITNEVKTSVNVGVLKDRVKQSFADSYEKGMNIKTFENVKGISKNTDYTVVGKNNSNNTLKLKSVEPSKDGSFKYSTVNATSIAGKVSVSKSEDRQFGEGDKIRITETNKEMNLTNSDQGIITKMDTKNKIATVDFGDDGIKKVDLNKHKGVELGYSMTNHSAQGISVAKVVASFNSEKNKQMNTMNSFYVAMSRQTAKSTLVVNNKDKLMAQVSKSAKNVSSLDKTKDLENKKENFNNKLKSSSKKSFDKKFNKSNDKKFASLQKDNNSFDKEINKSNNKNIGFSK